MSRGLVGGSTTADTMRRQRPAQATMGQQCSPTAARHLRVQTNSRVLTRCSELLRLDKRFEGGGLHRQWEFAGSGLQKHATTG